MCAVRRPPTCEVAELANEVRALAHNMFCMCSCHFEGIQDHQICEKEKGEFAYKPDRPPGAHHSGHVNDTLSNIASYIYVFPETFDVFVMRHMYPAILPTNFRLVDTA